MKKLLLTLLAIMAVSLAEAQIKTDRIDEFTGERTIVTERVRLLDIHAYTLTAELIRKGDGKDYIRCNFWANRPFTINKGDNLFLKFADGTIMKAVCAENAAPKASGMGGERRATFLCSPETGLIEKMAETQLTRFKLETSLGDYELLGDIEYDIKARRARQMREQAVAFLEALGQKQNKK